MDVFAIDSKYIKNRTVISESLSLTKLIGYRCLRTLKASIHNATGLVHQTSRYLHLVAIILHF